MKLSKEYSLDSFFLKFKLFIIYSFHNIKDIYIIEFS